MLIDSHCHLLYPQLNEGEGGLAAVLTRAKAAGVVGMMSICCDPLDEWEQTQKLVAENAHIWCSYGVHPHDAAKYETLQAAELVAQAAHPKIVALGECGLDYFYDKSPRAVQLKVFEQHVEAALAADLPLVIHTRDAEEDTMAVLRAGGGNLKGVLHCFTGSQALCDFGLEIGFYISASGITTFKASDALRAVFATIPLEKMLVETDSPYLAPQPYRGKMNEPAYVAETARAMAALKNTPYETFCAQTTQNFFTLFSKAALP